MGKLHIFIVGSLLAHGAGFAAKNMPIPTQDQDGAKDPALVGRMAGSVILSQVKSEYEEVILPLSALKRVPEKRDRHNNGVVAPDESMKAQGRHVRLVYLMPEGVSPLQVQRNYQNSLAGQGGKTLYECAGTGCGGSAKAVRSGGSTQSLPMFLWDQDKITDKPNSAAYCAQSATTADLRYAALEVPSKGSHVSVIAYQLSRSYCKVLDGRTVAIVDVIENAEMEQKIVVVDAGEMAKSIAAEGRVALYGIYFDAGKAEVKPESKAALEQIAKLLAGDRSLKLLVVGHTDNTGGYPANLDLSRKRAESVVSTLVGTHRVDGKRLQATGVSFASPVASNASEEGKAKNRRVELVPLN